MSKLEVLEKNKIRLVFDIDADKLEDAINFSYNKNKSKINITGFRKGKAPRRIIELNYGPGIFYEDAINYVLPKLYEDAITEHKLDVISKPQIDVLQIESGKGAVVNLDVFVKPQIVLGQYKDIEIEYTQSEVSEEEIQNQIQSVSQQNARIVTITDRAVEFGDIVTIDGEGFIDDVAFEGGKITNYELKIGSKTFIDNFEDQLISKNIGEDIDVYATFPEDYGRDDLKSKKAHFKVKIKGIKYEELPQIDDEFAKDVSEFNTLEEYKENIKNNLQIEKNKKSIIEKENLIIDELVQKTEVDLPQPMINARIDRMILELKNNLQSQGSSIEMYMKFSKQNIDDIKNIYTNPAIRQLKSELILEQIAKDENIEILQDEINAELSRVATIYKLDINEFSKLISSREIENIIFDLKLKKALQLVMDSAKIK